MEMALHGEHLTVRGPYDAPSARTGLDAGAHLALSVDFYTEVFTPACRIASDLIAELAASADTP
jgi:hypothetical protein